MCRTVNGFDINAEEMFDRNIKNILDYDFDKVEYVSGVIKDGRGNICPQTIILPTIAMEARFKTDKMKFPEENHDQLYKEMVVANFMSALDKVMDDTKDGLLERFKHIASQPAASGKFMYENGTMEGYIPEEGIVSALKHGTLTLGQIGLSECLYILIGKDQTTDEGMVLAKEIEQKFNDKCKEYKAKYHMNFGVYLTPAENLCYTSMSKFKRKYGDVENVTYFIDKDGNKNEKDFFTNSIHVPVYDDIDPFKKIDIESELTGYSNAGCITYVELPASSINNIDALETIVDYALDKDIPYFALNVPSDTCEDCGFQGELPEKCPKCGSTNISRLRRVTG